MMMVQPSERSRSISVIPILSSVGFESGEPFVEQEDLRIGGERPRQLHALLIDVGQGRYRRARGIRQAHALQQRVRVVVELLAPAPRMPENAASRDIFQRRHRRQHAHELKSAGDALSGDVAGAAAGDRFAVNADLARGRFQRAGNQIHHRGLAGAVRPDQAKDLPFGKLERHIVDRDETAEAFGDGGGSQCFGDRGAEHYFLSAVTAGCAAALAEMSMGSAAAGSAACFLRLFIASSTRPIRPFGMT